MKNQILMDGEIRQMAGSNLTGYNSRFAKAGFHNSMTVKC